MLGLLNTPALGGGGGSAVSVYCSAKPAKGENVCLELYSPHQKITIPFVREHVRFLTPQSLRGRYTVLVRNDGDGPIDHLCWLYPRGLLSGPDSKGDIVLKGSFSDDLDLPFVCRTEGDQLTVEVPHPNEPEKNMPGIVGKYSPDNYFFALPPRFGVRHIALLNAYGFSAVYVKLKQPLLPQAGHWFAWEVTTQRYGTLIEDSVVGPHVFHYFASPVYVHRTVRETYLAGITDFDVFNDYHAEHYPAHVTTVEQFGLKEPRQVDIKYHQLLIVPGNPKKCVLNYWDWQGDLRMMSGSPQIVDDEDEGKIPVFEWKSGSILKPEHFWKDLGFMLRVVLRFAP